jgi:hypothetical protein
MADKPFKTLLKEFLDYLTDKFLAPRGESVKDWFEVNVGLSYRTLDRWRKGLNSPSRDNWNSFAQAVRHLNPGSHEIGEFLAVLRGRVEKEKELKETVEIDSSYLDHRQVDGFELVTDGIILSTAAELIHEGGNDFVSQCPRSYQRCLEDLAFAVVYCSRLATAKDFRPRLTGPAQPVTELVSRLGELCVVDALSADLVDGKLLEHQPTVEALSHDIETLNRSVSDLSCLPYFREWLTREAKLHFGGDDSVFDNDLEFSDYQYDVKRPYYVQRQLQHLICGDTIRTLIEFLPSSPDNNKHEPYAPKARHEFLTRNILTLLTIDREYDESARRTGRWRMPYVLRSLIKRKSAERLLLEQQAYLREILVTNALGTALTRVLRSRRVSLITVLLNMRDESPFREVHQVLAHEDLFALQPDTGHEAKARRIIKVIEGYMKKASNQVDSFVLTRRSALRTLSTDRASQFEQDLYRVFPELTPIYSAGMRRGGGGTCNGTA